MDVTPHPPSLEATLELSRNVTGFCSDGQAGRLWTRARSLPAGSSIVEIGSHFGKSTIVLASAASDGVDVIAIDPHLSGPYASATDADGEAVHAAFHANLKHAGVDGKVRHIRRPSQSSEALGSVYGPVDLLYVDGDHRYDRARDDLRLWGPRVRPGGSLFVHDCYSSPYVTLAVLRILLASSSLRYVRRERSLVEYVAEPLEPVARARNIARQLTPMTWFARNVVVKLALKAGRPRIARALGHLEPGWPY